MVVALRVNMSTTRITDIIERANEALRTGLNVDLMIRRIRAYLDSKFTLTLEIENTFIGLLAALIQVA